MFGWSDGFVGVLKPTFDLFLLPTRYGLFIFGFFPYPHIDPFKKRDSILGEKQSLKKLFFVPWEGVTAWELIDVDDPRRIVLLVNILYFARISVSLFSRVFRLGKKSLIGGFPAWFIVFEDPLIFRSRVFDEIVGYLRRYAGDKEVKGLEKNGSYVLVKKELEKAEIIDVVHKKPEEIWGGKKKSVLQVLKDLIKGEDRAVSMGATIERYQIVAGVSIIDLKKIGEKLGFNGFDLYLTDRGIALIPDVPELDLPRDRVYWKLDKNDPLVKKWAEILGVKRSLLTDIALLYKFIRAVNFRAASMFWALLCEDDTTPSTLTATKKMIEKIKKGEIKELTHIEPYGLREDALKMEDEDYILTTIFWDPMAAPLKVIARLGDTYSDEKGFTCTTIKALSFGSGNIGFVFPHPLKRSSELESFTLKEYLEKIYRVDLDKETREILETIYYENKVPEQIADEIHSEYERITREAPKTVKEIRKMGPKKYIPLLYYIY